MPSELLKNRFGLPFAFSLASALTLACGAGAMGCTTEGDDIGSSDGIGASTDDITQVDQTEVKRQSIGNCWLYATSSWLEALHKGLDGEELNTSESWLTYWHWFDQLANGRAYSGEISTGGHFSTAVDLIIRYGIMLEGDFIASEEEAEMSNRQSTALAAVNASLKDGPLKEAVSKRDRTAIRAELDKAWRLDEKGIARIDAVFGKDVSRTLDRSKDAVEAAADASIISSRAFEVRLKDTASGKFVRAKLSDAIGSGSGYYSSREGKYAFNSVSYPSDANGRRAFWKRVQKALHDKIPVVTSWKVDFNALDAKTSHFSLTELERRGVGRQGGHMTVMHDYEADVPGFGLLKAGEEASAEELAAALDDETVIHFVRVKNSWGGIRPDRWADAAIPGYHDLELGYLNGPIIDCPEETKDKSTCTRKVVPLWDVVLPAGY